MIKSNSIKILIVVITAFAFAIFSLDMVGTKNEVSTDEKLKLLATPEKDVTPQNVKEPAKQVKNTDNMDFKVAPEYNDFFAASQLIANAINPTLEKEWVKHRLGTRVARENAAREKAELEEQTYHFEKLQVAAQIDAMEKGELSIDLDTIARSLSGDKQFSKSNALVTNKQTAEPLVVENIKLTSMQQGEGGDTVSLRFGETPYRNLGKGAVAHGYTINDISIETMCVYLKDRFGNSKSVCMG